MRIRVYYIKQLHDLVFQREENTYSPVAGNFQHFLFIWLDEGDYIVQWAICSAVYKYFYS